MLQYLRRFFVLLAALLPLVAQTPVKKTVFVVHGIAQSYQDMQNLATQLSITLTGVNPNSGFTIAGFGANAAFVVDWGYDFGDCANSHKLTVPTNPFDSGKPCTIDTGARRLAHYIANQNPAGNEVIIVAYSLGGLIARQMIAQDYLSNVSVTQTNNKYYVSTMITLGTPNFGYPYDSSLDYIARNNILVGQMYGDFSRINPGDTQLPYTPTLPPEAGNNGQICETVTSQGYTVRSSQFLCDLNATWSLPTTNRPRKWLAAAGRLSSVTDRRSTNPSDNGGCSVGWWEDGVVCEESALLHTYNQWHPPAYVLGNGSTPVLSILPNYDPQANTLTTIKNSDGSTIPLIGPDEKWHDPSFKFAHTSDFTSWLVFAGSSSNHIPLYNPIPGSGLYETIITDITADAYNVMVTSPVNVSPTSNVYVGQTVTGSYAIQNVSSSNITLANLVLGGRLYGQCPNNVCPDLGPTVTNLTLSPGQIYSFSGSRQITAAGHYDFFVAYQLSNSSSWITAAPTSSGVANLRSIDVVAAPTFTLSPSTQSKPVVAGQSVSADISLQSQNSFAGSPSVGLWCEPTCPAGFTYSYPTGAQSLAANASLPLRVTFSTNTSATPGVYNYEYRATLGSTAVVAKIAITVTSPASTTPTMVFSPATQSKSVVVGQSVYADLTLQSQNGFTGNPSLGLWCMQSTCPAGFTYSYLNGSGTLLPANGSIPARITFNTTSGAVPGTYNYEYRASLSGITAVAKIAVTVSSPPATAFSVTAASSVNLPQVTANSLNVTVTNNSATAGTIVNIADYILASAWPTGLNDNFPASVTMPAIGQSATFALKLAASSVLAVTSYPMQIQSSISGLTVYANYTLNVTANTPTAVTVYSNPLPIPTSSYTWSLSSWQSFGPGWVMIPDLFVAGNHYTYGHPEQYIQALQQIKSWGASGSLDTYISQFQSALPYWPPYTVVAPSGPSTLTGYCTVNGSTMAQSFSTGSNIVWNANISGGIDPKNFNWSGFGASIGNYQSVVLVPNAAASYNSVSVIVRDSGNPLQQLSLACPAVTVIASQSLGCGCSLNPNPINLGSGSTISASCVGGTGSYLFLLPGSSIYTGTGSALMSPTTRGVQTYTITGKDSSGNTASGFCSLSVN
ncbi:MAG: hypothetical protein P4L74_00300 [Candidatus Doudnabacteria bacterium]|nr:hypothetical protein [Candidatus Doudnabacteria bacterium]